MVSMRHVERAVGRLLPSITKEAVTLAYNRFRTFEADRGYEPIDVSASPTESSPRHVVVLVVDALRHDFLSAETAPFLTDKCSSAAVAPAPWTFPSVISLLTGQYPHEHGAMRQSDEADNTTEAEIQLPSVPETVQTLPELLGGVGYETYGAFGFAMPFLALSSRFATHRLYADTDAEKLLSNHSAWLSGRETDRTFSYLHLSDLHTPHHPPSEYIDAFDVDLTIDGIRKWRHTAETASSPETDEYREHKRRLYRASLAYIDDCLAEHVERLQDRLGAEVTLVVTGDHGEGFWDRAAFDAEHFTDSRPAYCVGHGGTPYECIARVPLWIDGVDVDVETPSLVDVTPTLLEQLGVTGHIETTGVSLTEASNPDRPVLIEAARYGHEKKAIYAEGWKLLQSLGDEATFTYRPGDEPTTALDSSMRDQLSDSLPPWPDGETVERREVSSTVEDQLKDLGYQ